MASSFIEARDVVCGFDVGKSFHHAFAMERATGEVLLDRRVAQDEGDIRAALEGPLARGSVLVAIDQLNNIGALVKAVALDMGCEVGYLPGFRMRNAANFFGEQSKTDAADARVIARAAASSPDLLLPSGPGDAVVSELKVLLSLDEDMRKECTSTQARLRFRLAEMHPALERAFSGHRLRGSAGLAVLERFGGPHGLSAAGRESVLAEAVSASYKASPAERLVNDIFDALGQQTVEVPGSIMAEQAVSIYAARVRELLEQRARVLEAVEDLLEFKPEAWLLQTIPGVDVLTSARLVAGIVDISRFETPERLASYSGFAPVRRESGTSIKSSFQGFRANKMLKDAMFKSAFVAANTDPRSKEYYRKKRAEGKHHNAAVSALARNRVNVIYSVLKGGEPYREPDSE